MTWPTAALLIALVTGLTVMACFGAQNVGSMKNCAHSCGGQMASYTERRENTVGSNMLQLVPVCECEKK